jgi:ABC-type phosphate/phosphonate transport system ATPase subunit
LLADEPFTGLDTKSCQHLIAVLEDFGNNGGTVLMTTHDASIGLACCKRVVLVDKQKIAFDAKTCDIDKTEFAKDYVAYAQGVR